MADYAPKGGAGNEGAPAAKKRKAPARVAKPLLAIAICAAALVCAINAAVVLSTRGSILSPDDAAAWADAGGGADCILVLGASVDGISPSPILAYRLDAGIEALSSGASDVMLLSGDNGTVWYNEVAAMEDYVLKAIGSGEKDRVYLDYAGFSTYDSLYRCKAVFGAKRVVIATQRYHLYRALWIARALGIDAVGVCAQDIKSGQAYRDAREVPARLKDFFMSIAKPDPTFLGDPIPLDYPKAP